MEGPIGTNHRPAPSSSGKPEGRTVSSNLQLVCETMKFMTSFFTSTCLNQTNKRLG